MIAAFRITVVFLVLAQATAAWGDDAAAALVETCKALRSNEPVRMTSTLTLESTRSGPPVTLDPITAVIDRTGPGTGVLQKDAGLLRQGTRQPRELISSPPFFW